MATLWSSSLVHLSTIAHLKQGHLRLVLVCGGHLLEMTPFVQGLWIGYTTGLVTWDTTYVSPGDYSVQLVVMDALNGLKV